MVGTVALVAGWAFVGSGFLDVDATPHSEVPPEPPCNVEMANDGIAMRYARAIRDGNPEEAIRLTWWMNERIDYVRMASSDPDAVHKARAELARQLQSRPVERNQLSTEGMEDKYIFAPAARLEAVSVDKGRAWLAKPVRERVWIRVTYPAPGQAPLDTQGAPIRSLLAGVNVSTDGYVLKAGVRGNLDIDRESFTYDWTDVQGGL